MQGRRWVIGACVLIATSLLFAPSLAFPGSEEEACPGKQTWKKVVEHFAPGLPRHVDVELIETQSEMLSTVEIDADISDTPHHLHHDESHGTHNRTSERPDIANPTRPHKLPKEKRKKPFQLSFEPHLSGTVDNATAIRNILDAAEGRKVHRSNYSDAPGGTVCLKPVLGKLLMELLADGDVRIRELAGGSHTKVSGHYGGNSVDITSYKGKMLAKGVPETYQVIKECKRQQAAHIYHVVLGDDRMDRQHPHRVHCQFGSDFDVSGKPTQETNKQKLKRIGDSIAERLKHFRVNRKKFHVGNKRRRSQP